MSHRGAHLLGTMPDSLPETERIERERGDCLPRGASDWEISEAGWRLAEKLWPDEFLPRGSACE